MMVPTLAQTPRPIGWALPDVMGSIIDVEVPNQLCLPADGVYAGWYERSDGSVYPCAINLGRRPTFYEHADHSLLEAHLIGFEGELYGEPAKVRFVEFLTGLAPVVVFSAATPGQTGTGHINEQWPVYWQSAFHEHGMVALDASGAPTPAINSGDTSLQLRP